MNVPPSWSSQRTGRGAVNVAFLLQCHHQGDAAETPAVRLGSPLAGALSALATVEQNRALLSRLTGRRRRPSGLDWWSSRSSEKGS